MFKLDIHTFIVLLVAGNLASIIILPAYRKGISGAAPYRNFMVSKVLQAIGWMLLGLRGDISDFLSVYAGNTFLLYGFCIEIMAITAVDGPDKKKDLLLILMTGLGITFFWIFASTPNLRVAIATFVSILIFLTAAVYFLMFLESSLLRITTGVFYSFICIILSFRVIDSLTANSDFSLMTPAASQTVGFMMLYVYIFVSGSGFLLIFREKGDRLLRESEYTFSTSFHSSPDAILITWLADGKIIEANSSFEKISGYKIAEIIGHTTIELNMLKNPGDRDRVIDDLISGREVKSLELEFRKKTGEKLTGLLSSAIIMIDGMKAIITTISDITDRKIMEESIQKHLAEKELLLKEVHHRIKNNLNTVIGLLHLQAEFYKERECSKILNDAGSRLYSMSIMYDRLYRSENFMTMPSADFIKSLIYDIVSLFPSGEKVEIRDQISDFPINADKLQPLAIIINELVTNSMKYAMDKNTEGFIELSAVSKGDFAEIVYRDSGKGINDGFSNGDSEGFGIQLIDMLVNQISGSMTINKGRGAECIIRFKL